MRVLPFAFAAFLGAAAIPGAPALAGEGQAPKPAPGPTIEERIGAIGKPADARAVRDLVRAEEMRDPALALSLVGALWHAGGYGAQRGLATLASHRDRSVRIEALKGVAHLGLRIAEGMETIRSATRSADVEERTAAFEALGRVGDAKDVPDLLAVVETCEPCPSHAGARALAALSGERVPAGRGRWRAWWDQARKEVVPRLGPALDTVARSKDEAARAAARTLLAKHAWLVLADATEAARMWLRAADPGTRIEGYRLAAVLRQGDLAEEVTSAVKYERHPEAFDAGLASAAVLGVPTAGLRRPDTYVPDRKPGN